jgi:Domain of unknown function (DUF4399)
MRRIALVAVAAMLSMTVAGAGETASPGDAKVYFINLKNNDIVTSPLTIQFGLSGMGIAPAGTNAPGTGHHHLIIDDAITGAALDQAIPLDDRHLHFGKGQTEATVALPKGTHTLQLVLGDWSHVPHNRPVMSERVTIVVR